MSIETVMLLIVVGFMAGVMSGLVGIGGGIIVVPGLVYVLGFSQQEAQGTSLGLLLLPIGILAVVNYYNKGFIDVKVVAIMCLAFVVGGWVGSKIALQISVEIVKKIFAVLLFYTAFKMLNWDTLILKWAKGLFH
ncbi:MAG: sulfite exporter TauE/SafE family protein [Chitinophagaceae bacterium]